MEASPSLSNDQKLVYVGSRDGFIYAIDALNGLPIWKTQLVTQVITPGGVQMKSRDSKMARGGPEAFQKGLTIVSKKGLYPNRVSLGFPLGRCFNLLKNKLSIIEMFFPFQIVNAEPAKSKAA